MLWYGLNHNKMLLGMAITLRTFFYNKLFKATHLILRAIEWAINKQNIGITHRKEEKLERDTLNDRTVALLLEGVRMVDLPQVGWAQRLACILKRIDPKADGGRSGRTYMCVLLITYLQIEVKKKVSSPCSQLICSKILQAYLEIYVLSSF